MPSFFVEHRGIEAEHMFDFLKTRQVTIACKQVKISKNNRNKYRKEDPASSRLQSR